MVQVDAQLENEYDLLQTSLENLQSFLVYRVKGAAWANALTVCLL